MKSYLIAMVVLGSVGILAAFQFSFVKQLQADINQKSQSIAELQAKIILLEDVKEVDLISSIECQQSKQQAASICQEQLSFLRSKIQQQVTQSKVLCEEQLHRCLEEDSDHNPTSQALMEKISRALPL